MLARPFPYRLTSDDGVRMVLLHRITPYNTIVTFLIHRTTYVSQELALASARRYRLAVLPTSVPESCT
jgi:hypothetical protein